MSPTVATARSTAMPAVVRPHLRPRTAQPQRVESREGSTGVAHLLASYIDVEGRAREVVARAGASGSVLVIDWDAATMGDKMLVAHLAPDEPTENAAIVCDAYTSCQDARWCRRVEAEDLLFVPPYGLEATLAIEASGCPSTSVQSQGGMPVLAEVRDEHGGVYRLAFLPCSGVAPELRWCAPASGAADGQWQPVSVRDVVGAMESYEAARITAKALLEHGGSRSVAASTLASELARLHASRIILNRGLRDAVVSAVSRGEVSMSKIALRCGRVKHDGRGISSGETTWLARRIGLVGEGGAAQPTPWVHSDVLALIARRGLGISPREVELA